MMGTFPVEFVKAETDYRRERLASSWSARSPRRYRPQVASRPFGALLHRFGVGIGAGGVTGPGHAS